MLNPKVKEILQCKAKLTKLDTKDFKYLEGLITEEEFIEAIGQKQELRARINEIEEELKSNKVRRDG